MLNRSLNGGGGEQDHLPPSSFPHAPPTQRPCHTRATQSSLYSAKDVPTGGQAGPWGGGGGSHRRADRRRRMRTSSEAKAFASESRTRRFSFRRACEWSLARHGAQWRRGVRIVGPEPGEGVPGGGEQCGLGSGRGTREGGGAGKGGATRGGEGAARRRLPTTGPCGMLYWRSTAASSASERTA